MYRTVPLSEGEDLMIKRMEGEDGARLPRHTASMESALTVVEGSCIVEFEEGSHTLHVGDSLIIPPDAVHQVIAAPSFKAIHVLPKDIRFNFKV